MKKTYLYSLFARCLTLLVLALLSTNLAWGATVSGTFTKITSLSDLTTGQYVIVGAQKAAGLGKLTYGTLSSGRIPYTQDYTSAPASITNPAGASVWDVTVSETSVTLYNAENNKYIADANSGKLKYETSGMSFTAACSNGVFSLASGTYFLCVNATSNYWRNYAASTGYNSGVCLYFYKKQTTPTHTLTLSATNGSITVKNGETAINSGDDVKEGAELNITATANDWYKFSGWNVSGTGSTLGSTTANPTTFTMGTADATLTATFAACVVTVSSNDENWGIALYDDESHTISTSAEDGYRISLTNPYTINPANAATLTPGEDGEYTVSGVKDQDVTITFNFEAIPTVAYTVTFDGNGHGTPASASITEASATAGVTLPDCTPNADFVFKGWATTNTATEAEYAAGATYYPTANITLYAVYKEICTITWSVNGTPTIEGNPTTSVVAGEGITTLPTAPADISGMAFQGWTATQIAESSATKPTDLFTDAEHAPEITTNTTFYAVFAEQSEGASKYVKVTTAPADWCGKYLIVYETGNVAFDGSLATLDAESNTKAVTISNNVIASSADMDAIAFTVAYKTGSSTVYSLKSASGKYISGTKTTNKASNGVVQADTDADFEISFNGTTIESKSSDKQMQLKYNKSDGQTRFRFYGNGQEAIALYKKTQEITYTYYTNIVVKELTSISLSGDYPTEFWKGDAFSHKDMIVTAHYSNAPDADVTSKATFSTPDMATAGEQTVTVTYDTKSTTYNITIKTIANTEEDAYTTAQAKELIDAGKDLETEVYVKGTVSKVDKIETGAITYWLDENAFEVYKGKNIEGADFTNVNEIAVGDEVVIYGKIKKYSSTYEFAEGNYLVSHVKASTLEIKDITVSLGEEISPEITTNVPEAGRTITYSVASENVVKVDEEGKLVTVAVGGPVEVTATLTAEGYKDATTTFDVTVIKALQSITVKTAPTTTSYKAGDKFDPTGLVITAKYNDESTEDVAYAGNKDKFTFTPSLETALTTDVTSVTITYAGKEATQEITVRALYTYDITWMANGKQFTTTEVTEGNALTLPETSPEAIGDYVFKGWIATENYFNAETAPTYIVPADIIPTEAMTFYAVYAKEEKSETVQYTLVSNENDFVDGVYVIAAKSSSNYYFINGNYTKDGLGVEDVGLASTSINDNSFASTLLPTSAIELNVVSNNDKEDYYFISYTKEAKTYYMYATSSKTSLTWSDKNTTESFSPNFKAKETKGCVLLGSSGSKVSNNGSTKESFIRNYDASGGSYYNDIYFFIKNNPTICTNYTTSIANMSITAAKWGTFCAPFDVELEEGVKAYKASEDNGTINFEEVSGTIEAGTPVVVYKDVTETYTKDYSAAVEDFNETCQDGALVGVYAAKSGITAETGYTNYVLQNNTQGVGFYKVAEGSTISLKANRCYMTLPTSSAAKDGFAFEDIITGINNILNPSKKSVEGIFDLNGRKLAAPQKGINIINGVKVIVK